MGIMSKGIVVQEKTKLLELVGHIEKRMDEKTLNRVVEFITSDFSKEQEDIVDYKHKIVDSEFGYFHTTIYAKDITGRIFVCKVSFVPEVGCASFENMVLWGFELKDIFELTKGVS